jgi:hypothetical protein
MAYEPPVAVYDACVLYPFHLRNLLIQCAVDRLVDARWTERIQSEWMRGLFVRKPGLARGSIERTRDLMNRALPDALVAGYEEHISGITLRDLDDRHVVAAGIASRASLIVTWNLRDFPLKELEKHNLGRRDPDAFLMDIHDRVPELLVEVTANARRNLAISAPSADGFLGMLARQRLHRFARAMAADRRRL